ncbi:MAG TPA: hypothetical protein VF771_01600 [Longimicrobiaceae bacterium]
MTDLYADVEWCLRGTSAEQPLALDGLVSCIDYRQHLVATHDEVAAALRRLRAEGRVAGTARGYFVVAADGGEPPPFAPPAEAEHDAAVAKYQERMQRLMRSG